MSNKNMERCPTLSVTREIQIETTSYDFMSTRMSKIKMTTAKIMDINYYNTNNTLLVYKIFNHF